MKETDLVDAKPNFKKISVDMSAPTTKTVEKTVKTPKNRIVTATTKWHFDTDDLTSTKQMEYINQIYTDKVVTECESTCKFISQQIAQKIYGYYSQDLKNEKYTEALFVNIDDVIKLLCDCNNMCFYCKEPVQVLYEKVREPKQWTLDRLDNSTGHNKTNVVIACLHCNLCRKTMHPERYVFTKQLNIVKIN
jgi:hypothetical protein